MNQILLLYLFMIAVFAGYVSYIWNKYGIQTSISESYYVLPSNHKFLFIAFCFGFAIPAIMLGNTSLMFLAGSFIMFVGAAPLFKMNIPHWVHMIGAYAGIIFGEISLCIDFKLWPIAAMFVGLATFLFIIKPKNHIWWIELLAFLSICVGLGIHTFK